eukprot:scaffold101_cov373-Prasinococcus_capsulatus_cf.AAC.2
MPVQLPSQQSMLMRRETSRSGPAPVRSTIPRAAPPVRAAECAAPGRDEPVLSSTSWASADLACLPGVSKGGPAQPTIRSHPPLARQRVKVAPQSSTCGRKLRVPEGGDAHEAATPLLRAAPIATIGRRAGVVRGGDAAAAVAGRSGDGEASRRHGAAPGTGCR